MKDRERKTIEDIKMESQKNEQQKQAVDVKNIITKIDKTRDSDFLNVTNDFQSKAYEIVSNSDKMSKESETLAKREAMTDDEMVNIFERVRAEVNNIPAEQQKKWVMDQMSKAFGHILPESLLNILTGSIFEGDTGVNIDSRPDWLDMDKFRRGQQFAMDNWSSISYSELLSLFMVYSFGHGFESVLFTGNSNTPYASFKRYMSTASRVHNWYAYDVWTSGNPGNDDMRIVRKMHTGVRNKLKTTSFEELKRITKIDNPWCPALDITRRDFQSSCPAPLPNQCPYTVFNNYPNKTYKAMSQGDMSATQFAFVGLAVYSPKTFGLHHATDEDLEAFCHTWRGFGYLLGIDDDFNFCRGTLEDVRARTKDFIEFWVKPNFRDIKPECEHVMRCVIEGAHYYFPATSYENCLFSLAEILNLQMPTLYNTLPYKLWIEQRVRRLYFNHGIKFTVIRRYLNNQFIRSIEKAKQYDKKKHDELQQRSAKTLSAATVKTEIHASHEGMFALIKNFLIEFYTQYS